VLDTYPQPSPRAALLTAVAAKLPPSARAARQAPVRCRIGARTATCPSRPLRRTADPGLDEIVSAIAFAAPTDMEPSNYK